MINGKLERKNELLTRAKESLSNQVKELKLDLQKALDIKRLAAREQELAAREQELAAREQGLAAREAKAAIRDAKAVIREHRKNRITKRGRDQTRRLSPRTVVRRFAAKSQRHRPSI